MNMILVFVLVLVDLLHGDDENVEGFFYFIDFP